MANKTNTVTEMKHAMLDIEIEIDEDIARRIRDVKDAYNDAIESYKVKRASDILTIKKERKTLIKAAKANLMEA